MRKLGGCTIACLDPFYWSGKIESVNFQLTAEGFSGEMKAAITPNTEEQVTGGSYTFILDGKIVGDTVGGTFRGELDDKELRTGALFGAVK
jgi:hypothetical protein